MNRAVDLTEVFERYLRNGERLLWTGRPNPRRHVATIDVLLIPFSLLWGGVVIFVLVLAVRSGTLGWPSGEAAVAAFFFAAALYMLFGRFVHKAYKKKRTFYAVTDRRVVYLARRRLRDKLYDMPFEDIRKIAGEDTVVDGCGSLTFSRRGVGGFLDPWDWQRDLFCMWGHRGAVLFYDVDGALDLRDWVARLRSVRQEERSGLAAPPLR